MAQAHPTTSHRHRVTAVAFTLAISLGGCGTLPFQEAPAGAAPAWRFPVTSNDTPYSQCLAALAKLPGERLPAVAVGEVADKTGQFETTGHGALLSQGAAEMVMSALFKTRKVHLIERFDLRVANQDLIFRKNKLIGEPLKAAAVRGADFIVTGALTELNYNIASGGVGLWINGAGAGTKYAVINVALDLRVINARTLDVLYVSSLQKQIVGQEVEANIFRFFGGTLVELDAGKIRNEPVQLGVRSVTEMAVHQIMTDFLGLPASNECRLVTDDTMARNLTSTHEGDSK